MKKRSNDHCVFQNNVLKCLHCGGTFELKLPMDMKDVGKKASQFIKLHADCEKQP